MVVGTDGLTGTGAVTAADVVAGGADALSGEDEACGAATGDSLCTIAAFFTESADVACARASGISTTTDPFAQGLT